MLLIGRLAASAAAGAFVALCAGLPTWSFEMALLLAVYSLWFSQITSSQRLSSKSRF